jgi:hypothetical protein
LIMGTYQEHGDAVGNPGLRHSRCRSRDER